MIWRGTSHNAELFEVIDDPGVMGGERKVGGHLLRGELLSAEDEAQVQVEQSQVYETMRTHWATRRRRPVAHLALHELRLRH
jgi:hypothetical protein